jgi:hypothetical protein
MLFCANDLLMTQPIAERTQEPGLAALGLIDARLLPYKLVEEAFWSPQHNCQFVQTLLLSPLHLPGLVAMLQHVKPPAAINGL